MPSPHLLVTIILGILSILNLFYGAHYAQKNILPILNSQETSTKITFIDPELAARVMGLLYDYKPIDKRYINHEKDATMRLDDIYLGLTQDNHYCNGVQEWVTEKVGAAIVKKRVFTDYSPTSLLRKDVLNEMKADLQPEINSKMADWLQEKVLKRIILFINC